MLTAIRAPKNKLFRPIVSSLSTLSNAPIQKSSCGVISHSRSLATQKVRQFSSREFVFVNLSCSASAAPPQRHLLKAKSSHQGSKVRSTRLLRPLEKSSMRPPSPKRPSSLRLKQSLEPRWKPLSKLRPQSCWRLLPSLSTLTRRFVSPAP